jgi:transposase
MVYRHWMCRGRNVGTGLGGHRGVSQESSAVDLPPHIDTRISHFPGPRNRRYNRPRLTGRHDAPGASIGILTTEGAGKKRLGRRTAVAQDSRHVVASYGVTSASLCLANR